MEHPDPPPVRAPGSVGSVRNLDNDVQSIYDLLAELDVGVKKVQASQLRRGSRLDQIEDRLAGVDGKLDTVLDLLRRDCPTDG